jgi:hypothetical protein
VRPGFDHAVCTCLLATHCRLGAVRSRFWRIWINPTPLRLLDDPDPSMSLGLGLVSLQTSFFLLFLLFPTPFLLSAPLYMLKITWKFLQIFVYILDDFCDVYEQFVY